ncbi:sulfurtransferase [Virgibacillus oceani]|uniref:Thiosulfate sulfurtransferase n=1 Tax=Virgibacillus oceani TaxID=1479511 RepID=A0A917HK81_9BACI|nr:sulfurtransferase [Virgibacillus oceani]GGG81319.1 thiosulfate sulfurtransferase [Virgibacillus oceani]
MSHLVSVKWLAERLKKNPETAVVIDVRFSLTDAEAGKKAYEKGHIPGAMYLNLNKDLSSPVQEHGGNHPLPDVDDFSTKLGEIGVDRETTVVIYDQHNDMFAARLWWLLQYMGHEKAYVLDGGLDEWSKRGHVITNKIQVPSMKQFKPSPNEDMVIDIDGVKEKIGDSTSILIDSRAKDRYLGKTEPLYKKAGHIPGAKNFFWKDVLAADGFWKTDDELQTHFEKLPKENEIIVSCGSGVSACPNVLALKLAGYENVKLYPGSFSDWISYQENEVETKEE